MSKTEQCTQTDQTEQFGLEHVDEFEKYLRNSLYYDFKGEKYPVIFQLLKDRQHFYREENDWFDNLRD